MSNDPERASARTMAEQLLRINWQPDDRRLRSHVALMREYLRRAALWSKSLGCTEQWPFADFAAYLAPDSRAPQHLVEAVQDALTQCSLPAVMRDTCKYALHWAALHDLSEGMPVPQYGLPAPYEPLIRMYERGGHFYTQHGFVYILHVGIPTTIKGWQFYNHIKPILELDDPVLDLLDC